MPVQKWQDLGRLDTVDSWRLPACELDQPCAWVEGLVRQDGKGRKKIALWAYSRESDVELPCDTFRSWSLQDREQA